MTENTKVAENSELIREIPTGLLRWYPFVSGSRVLYIGSLEDAAALMLQESKGLVLDTIVPERLSDEDQPANYDYIICIAHLERLPDPGSILKKLNKMLAKKGLLLLGMNNRLGIRYFIGDKDPYTEGIFDGIEGYIGACGNTDPCFEGRMYDRSELERMLGDAAFDRLKFYSVFSDLSNPMFLFADGYIPNEDLCNRVFPAYHSPNTVFLDERTIYQSLIDNDLLHKMANAYLIECTSAGCLADALHVTCSVERGREDALITVIHENETVTKEAIYPEGKKKLDKLIENGEKLKARGIRVIDAGMEEGVYTMPLIHGKNGQVYLRELLQTDKDQFLTTLDHFRDLILQSSDAHEGVFVSEYAEKNSAEDDKPTLLLDEAMFDMVPLNSFFVDGEFIFYDQEFCFNNYPANILIVRMIASFYYGNPGLNQLLPRDELFQRYGVLENVIRWQKPEWAFLAKLRKNQELTEYHRASFADAATIKANRERMNYSVADYEKIFIDIFQDVDVKKLVLFGSGKYAQRFAEKYAGDHPIYAIADNNETRWGEEPEWIPGVKIVSPKIFSEIDKDTCKVIVCIRDYKPVLKQLDTLGIRDYCVYDPNRHYAESPQTVIRMGDKTQSTEKTEGHYHIGYVAGAFDMFHIGHLNLIRRAKERCDYLIAGVMSDERMYNLKKKYPVIPCRERMQVVAGCRYVDEVVELPVDRAGIMDAYNMLHYDCMFSGDDHASDPGWLAERERLRQHGSDLIFVSYTKDTSSTEIRERLK